MEHKTPISEANHMRNLMGLELLGEGKDDFVLSKPPGKGVASDKKATKKQRKEGFKDGDVVGVYSDIKDQRKEMSEDSEGEETYNYGDDEGHDRGEEEHLEHEEEMAPADRVREIERHLDALKKDMGYDEDHEDRDEEGTDFAESELKEEKGVDDGPDDDDKDEDSDDDKDEDDDSDDDKGKVEEGKTFKVKKDGKVISLTESELKYIINKNKIKKVIANAKSN